MSRRCSAAHLVACVLLVLGCNRPASSEPRATAPEPRSSEAEPEPSEPGLVPASDVRADAEYLYETLRSAHYDLFAHRDRPAYDAAHAELIASIDAPMTRLEAIRRLTAFVAYGRIGHARVDFPVGDTSPTSGLEALVQHLRAP